MTHTAKTQKTSKGEKHFSVGVLIQDKGKYLLIDRKIYPPGLASVAGHVDEGETPQQAIVRETKEEIGVNITNLKDVLHETFEHECYQGVPVHEWHVYACDWEGTIDRSLAETKGVAWFTPEEIKKHEKKLEWVWKIIFEKLGIL